MLPRPSTTELKAACALVSADEMSGTGFLVSAERLLTCNHVIKNAGDRPILVTFPHGRYQAAVEFVDIQNDCANRQVQERCEPQPPHRRFRSIMFRCRLAPISPGAGTTWRRCGSACTNIVSSR